MEGGRAACLVVPGSVGHQVEAPSVSVFFFSYFLVAVVVFTPSEIVRPVAVCSPGSTFARVRY